MSVLDFTKTISNGVLEKAKSFKSDWSINDETNPAYIKNRPFYETEPVETILLDQTLDFEDWDEVYGVEFNHPQEFIIGQSYTVIWDDEIYSDLVCFEDDGYPIIGASYLDFSTYPFGIGADGEWMWIYTDSIEDSHTIKVITMQSEIIKIDEKYLPQLVGESTTGNVYTVWNALEGREEEHIASAGAEIFNDYADNIATGEYSHAEGYETTATGEAAHAEGGSTQAFGYSSHAEGWYTRATGDYSHAEGYSTKATGDNSHAEGSGATASGYSSHSEGNSTKATGDNSHAEGGYINEPGTFYLSKMIVTPSEYTGLTENIDVYGPVAYGTQSHAEGTQTLAFGYSSHAEGWRTKAFGNYSHAEGYETIASGHESHAEGYKTKAAGHDSHAEGDYTQANCNFSHAEGLQTVAYGDAIHVQGKYNFYEYTDNFSEYTESTDYVRNQVPTTPFLMGDSYTFNTITGTFTINNAVTTTAIAANKYIILDPAQNGKATTIRKVTKKLSNSGTVTYDYRNITRESKYAHIVGNGDLRTRSNAHTLDWDGNAWFAGNVYVGANNKELATKEYVDSQGGSSGGVTSWDGLEDKPFGLIDNDNENYILPSTQMALASQDESMTMHILGNSIEGVALGVDYIVNYNGNNYICTAQSIDAGDGMVVTGLGNTAALGGEDTGEPFALAVLPPEVVSALGFGVALYSLDMAPSVTISISSNKTIKKLDNKFLNLDWLPTRSKTVELLYDQETSFNDSGQSVHAGKVYFEIVPGEEYTVTWNGTTYNCIGQLIPVEGTFFPAIGNASLINSNNPNTGEPFAIFIWFNTHTVMYSAMFNKDIAISITGPKYVYNTMPSQYMPNETNELALKKLTFIDADLETASLNMVAGKQLVWPGSIRANGIISANGKDLATIAYVNEKLGDIEALLAAI